MFARHEYGTMGEENAFGNSLTAVANHHGAVCREGSLAGGWWALERGFQIKELYGWQNKPEPEQ